MYLYFMVHILWRIAMHKALTTCVFSAPAPPVMRRFLDPSFPVTILEQFDRMQNLHTIRLKVFTVRVKKSLPKDVKLLTLWRKNHLTVHKETIMLYLNPCRASEITCSSVRKAHASLSGK